MTEKVRRVEQQREEELRDVMAAWHEERDLLQQALDAKSDVPGASGATVSALKVSLVL